MIKLSDKFQEVELFIGEIMPEKSDTEIINEVRNEFMFNIKFSLNSFSFSHFKPLIWLLFILGFTFNPQLSPNIGA